MAVQPRRESGENRPDIGMVQQFLRERDSAHFSEMRVFRSICTLAYPKRGPVKMLTRLISIVMNRRDK
jgi:hypothetical protein